VISKLFLPQHLMFHILIFAPSNCLINSARYVCKPWDTDIGSSHFAEAWERRACFKPGLYVENRTSKDPSYFFELKDDVNGQFERTDLGTPPKMGNIISTCDGILLLSTTNGHMFIVNPTINFWLRIPPLPVSRQHIFNRCQCTIARVPRFGKFKLFFVHRLRVSDISWYVFYVLRIGIDNSWKEIARKECSLDLNFFLKILLIGGNDLYWIAKKKVIVMDVDKEIIVQEYPLPHMLNSPNSKYLLMGGRLSCIVAKDLYKTFEIYILDFVSGKWSLYHEMGPFDYMAECGHELNIMSVDFSFWINGQIIFRVTQRQKQRGNIFPGYNSIHFGYNVKTKQLAKIEEIDVGNFAVWLYTKNLVSLPSTSA